MKKDRGPLLPTIPIPRVSIPHIEVRLPGQQEPAPVAPLDEQATAELESLMTGFQLRAKQEAKRFQETTDSEYWFCICFHNRAQKEEFLRQAGIFDLGDKYVDGVEAARRFGFKLPSALGPRKQRAMGKALEGLVGDDDSKE